MTLGGLVCMFVPTMILLSYCSDLESIAPPWVYLLNACGIFIYQVQRVRGQRWWPLVWALTPYPLTPKHIQDAGCTGWQASTAHGIFLQLRRVV
jgi:hypothetical protein